MSTRSKASAEKRRKEIARKEKRRLKLERRLERRAQSSAAPAVAVGDAGATPSESAS